MLKLVNIHLLTDETRSEITNEESYDFCFRILNIFRFLPREKNNLIGYFSSIAIGIERKNFIDILKHHVLNGRVYPLDRNCNIGKKTIKVVSQELNSYSTFSYAKANSSEFEFYVDDTFNYMAWVNELMINPNMETETHHWFLLDQYSKMIKKLYQERFGHQIYDYEIDSATRDIIEYELQPIEEMLDIYNTTSEAYHGQIEKCLYAEHIRLYRCFSGIHLNYTHLGQVNDIFIEKYSTQDWKNIRKLLLDNVQLFSHESRKSMFLYSKNDFPIHNCHKNVKIA